MARLYRKKRPHLPHGAGVLVASNLILALASLQIIVLLLGPSLPVRYLVH